LPENTNPQPVAADKALPQSYLPVPPPPIATPPPGVLRVGNVLIPPTPRPTPPWFPTDTARKDPN